MLKGFRDFILRGNVIDLAVAVIIGAAFSAITASLTADIFTPFIAAVVGAPDFSSWVVHIPTVRAIVPPNPLPSGYIPPGEIHVGKFLNSIINFLLNSAAIYFFIVLPAQKLLSRISISATSTTKVCLQCLSDIPIGALRCKFCGQPV